jgi:hypothetical protein
MLEKLGTYTVVILHAISDRLCIHRGFLNIEDVKQFVVDKGITDPPHDIDVFDPYGRLVMDIDFSSVVIPWRR